MEWNRLDICEAYCLYFTLHCSHLGQESKERQRLNKMLKHFKPVVNLTREDLSENAQMILAKLEAKNQIYTVESVITLLEDEITDSDELNAYAHFFIDTRCSYDEPSEDDFRDKFEGNHENWKAFCKGYVDSCYNLDKMLDEKKSELGNLVNYLTFDWEKMARDWEISGDWTTIELEDTKGIFFFRNH